jgi:hypothetical protein
MPNAPDTPTYYVEVAHRFEELAEYVRNRPELDHNIADHLKGLADGILNDVGQRPPELPTALLAYSRASRLSRYA